MKPKIAVPLIITAVVTCIGLALAIDSTGKLALDPRNIVLHNALSNCPTYKEVAGDVRVGYTLGGDITIDFRKVKGDCRRIDPIHLILQFTGKLKDYQFGNLVIACQGKEKYHIAKADTDRLALNYDHDARGWSIMHITQFLVRPDGTHQFGEWEGGLLGVITHQLEDLGIFMKAMEADLATS